MSEDGEEDFTYHYKGTKFPIQISEEFKKKILRNQDSSKALFIAKSICKKPSDNIEINVPWDSFILAKDILEKIPKSIYSWYHETTSSSGNSTCNAVEAFSKIKIKPSFLNPDKSVSMERQLFLHSDELGDSLFNVKCPFFTVPYGCASLYGKNSDDLNTLIGTIKAGGIYTIPILSGYSVEYLAKMVKKYSNDENPFFMYQIYLTNDNDIEYKTL